MKVKNTYFHSQNNGIDHNQRKYCVFEWRRCDKPPDFQLNSFHRYITFDWFSFQCKFNAFSLKRISKMTRICLFFRISNLIFIEFTVFIFLFTLILKCNDNETDKDIHHKKCNDLRRESNSFRC